MYYITTNAIMYSKRNKKSKIGHSKRTNRRSNISNYMVGGGLFCKCAERCVEMQGPDFEYFKKFRGEVRSFLKCKGTIIDIIKKMKDTETDIEMKKGGRSKRTNYMVGGVFCDAECSDKCPHYILYDDYMEYMKYKQYFEYYLTNQDRINEKMNENSKDVPLHLLKCGEPMGIAGGGLKTLRYNNIMS